MIEVNFDGLVGPTHHFGGHSPGNLASISNQGSISSPKKAALEGLKKMSLLRSLGIPQGVLPPHLRPDIKTLEALGWNLENVPLEDLLLVSSASSMWAANSGVITPSCDSSDKKVHITPANLIHSFHRFIETKKTIESFKAIFSTDAFIHHPPIPAHPFYSDEGAANHVRLNGLHLFVYSPKGGRQSQEASKAIARSHGITERSLFLEQHPEAVLEGVFHNDVISFGHEDLFIMHEKAFARSYPIKEAYRKLCNEELNLIEISEKQLPLKEAVSSYFFNSQLVKRPNGKRALIATKQCESSTHIQKILATLPIDEVYYVDLSESMRNGGGPACLKISVLLTEKELESIPLLTEELEHTLRDWIEYYYPETLRLEDLKDPDLMRKNREALLELGKFI